MGEVCACNGVACVPAEHVLSALTTGFGLQRDKVIPGFEAAVAKASCPNGSIPLDEARRLIEIFCSYPVFGRSGRKSLADAVVEVAMAQLSSKSDLLGIVLYQDTLRKIGKALGTIGADNPRVVPYQFAERHSFYSYVLQDIALLARKRARELGGRVSINPDGTTGDSHRELLGTASPMEEVRIKMALPSFYLGLSRGHRLFEAIVIREMALLAALIEVMARRSDLKGAKRLRLELACDIARRGISGDPGYCILMYSGIGGPYEAPPINLVTRVNAAAANTLPIYRDNATMLNQQLPKWLDTLLAMLGDDPEMRTRWAPVVAGIVRDRREMQKLLENAETMLKPLNWPDHRIAQYLGPPASDATDRIDGSRADSGWGIAHLPFLLGVLDANSQDYPGLNRLLLYDSSNRGEDTPAPC